eukprot:11286280-Alexandrium_andersonii.AAC.1
MSASLVGSEMCIRDRHHIASRALASDSISMGAPPELGAKHLGGAFQMSVSYTHLTLPTICSV